jgi:hypothetical protein
MFLWNHLDSWNQTAQEWSLEGPLQTFGFICRSEIQDGRHKSCRSHHFEFHIGTKNLKIVEDHPMNIHVQFGFNNICSFWEDSLTLDPMGKMFQNASSLKPLGQLKPNCPGMIIGRSSTNFRFYMPIGNPRHLMNIHVQFGFNNICSFWEEGIWTFSHRVQC